MNNRKIKVLRIVTRLNIGGPSIHVILLESYIRKDLFEPVLVAGSPAADEGDMSGMAEHYGIKVRRISQLKRDPGLGDIAAFIKIAEIIIRERPDIVHTHMAKAGALGRMAAIVCGVKIKIHTFHGHVFDGYFSPLKTMIFTMIERVLALFTDRLIAVSDTVRSEIIKIIGKAAEDRCVTVELGLDMDGLLRARPRSGVLRNRLGIGDDAILVGIVGRLVPIKNHSMFIEVARRIKTIPGTERFKFIIVGDGESRENLVKQVKSAGLVNEVFFYGWAKDLVSIYSDIDIVALTSLNEGTPVAVIEAMAAARPVVATDVGGVRDVVVDGKTGLLVNAADIDGFVARVMRLALDGTTRGMIGNQAREAVRHRFAKTRLVSQIEQLYIDCLRKRKNTLRSM